MQAEKAIFHEFHLVLDEGLQHTLHDLRQEADERSLTKFISGVLKLLYPWLEYEHFFGKERKTRYRFVNDDPGVPRLHVHLNLSYSFYKRLKLMHQNLNFYSIAQLVRLSLEEFISLTKQYGARVRDVVEGRLQRSCTSAGIDLKINDNPDQQSGNEEFDNYRKKIRQLFGILNMDISEFSLITCYNGSFSPGMIFIPKRKWFSPS